MTLDALRQLRLRDADLAELIDRLPSLSSGGGLLAGWSRSTTADDPDDTRQVLPDPPRRAGRHGDRGQRGVATADTDQTIPVVVLGSAARAGDQLIAHAIGGRWVAELRKSGTPFVVCGTCDIPQENLTITVVGTGTFAGFGGTYPFVLGVGPLTWETATNRYGFGTMAYYFWDFGCLGGVLTAGTTAR